MNIFELEYKFPRSVSLTIQEHSKYHIEGWGLVTAGVVAAGSIGAAAISAYGSGGGSGGGGASGLTDVQQHALAALDRVSLGPAPSAVQGLQWSPTNYNVKKLTQGEKSTKTPYSTTKKAGFVPLYQRDKAGNVLYKDGQPQVNKNSKGQVVYVDQKVLPYKTDANGATEKDSNGHPMVDTSAKPDLKAAGYPQGLQVQKGSADLYGKKLQQVPYVSTVDQSRLQSDPQKGVQQLADQTGFQGNLSQQAQEETAFNQQQREQVAPGATQMMQQGGADINSWLKGEVPTSTAQDIQSAAASNFGGSYNPFTSAPGGVGQTSQNAMLKNLGLAATTLQQQGVSAAQSWQALADQLITKTGDKFQQASTNNQQNYAYDVLATNTNQELDARNYQANLTNDQIRNSPDPRAVGYLNDFLKLNSINDQNNLTVATNNQQTQLANIQLQQQYQMNLANLGLSKASAALGIAPSQLQQSNSNTGAALLGAGVQSSLPLIQALLSRQSGGGTYNTGVTNYNTSGWGTTGQATASGYGDSSAPEYL